jgi:hypothetical protein
MPAKIWKPRISSLVRDVVHWGTDGNTEEVLNMKRGLTAPEMLKRRLQSLWLAQAPRTEVSFVMA